MCLTIPGEVRRIDGSNPALRTAEVDFDGVQRTVRLVYLPEAQVGDFVMVHAGFATRSVRAEDAKEAWRVAREMRGEAPSAMETGALDSHRHVMIPRGDSRQPVSTDP